jgi:hypothetical protein
MPTEEDFSTPVVSANAVEVVYLPTGGRYTFARLGSGLSLAPPRVIQNHGTSPRWEVEWLARKLAEAVLRYGA